MSLPPEIRKKIKLLEVSTRKLVNSLFAGQYKSAFKGQGMTFSDFREYVPGDDVRDISWTLTARAGKAFIKQYEEERELTIILAVDVSGSMSFGSEKNLKAETTTHLAALLSFCAARNNDNVGLLLFSDQVEHFVPPKKGRGHVQRILRDLYYHEPKSQQTNVSVAVDYLSGILKKRSNVFLISDFLNEEAFGANLKKISRKHELISVVCNDPFEQELPDLGLIDVFDNETEEILCVDTGSKKFRQTVKDAYLDQINFREQEFKKSQVSRIDIPNSDEFVTPVLEYFKRKKR